MESESIIETEPAEAFSEFMSGLEQHVMHLVKESAKAPSDLYEHWQAFTHAIDWTESWIRGLLAFHAIMLILVVLTRKNYELQCFLFMFMFGMVLFSERINKYCSEHWREFATQNYFDVQGIFIGIMFSAPIIIIGFFQLVSFIVFLFD